MPVVKDTIKTALKTSMIQAMDQSDPDKQSDLLDKSADDLAQIIMEAIQSATVQPGITVQVDPNTGAGATTGPGELL